MGRRTELWWVYCVLTQYTCRDGKVSLPTEPPRRNSFCFVAH